MTSVLDDVTSRTRNNLATCSAATHVRQAHLPVPATGSTQDGHERVYEPGHEARPRYLSTNCEGESFDEQPVATKQDGGVLQRMGSIHAQGGPEEPQQAHTEGCPDLSSTVWGTLLLMASSPEVEAMRKQTQSDAEAVRQEGRRHTQGPLFVFAFLGMVKSLQETGNVMGARIAQGIAGYWRSSRQGGRLESHVERSDNSGTILYFRALQGHSGRNLIGPLYRTM